MRKFIISLLLIILFVIPISYADEFDTNIINPGGKPSGTTTHLYKHWGYYKLTGTRYVIRVYDWNTNKYISVPKEYYINHVYASDEKTEIMYLGVDKTKSGKYDVVRSGKSIFNDNTYSHVLMWYNNTDVSNFGLTKNDVNLLAQVIKEAAQKKGNTALAKNMQAVIDGTIPYDVRAEILFLMKLPGTSGSATTAAVAGKGSMEAYKFKFYSNKANSTTPASEWRRDYITYLEAKAISYALGDDCGITMKSYWLDRVACALYEKDNGYVFYNNAYQCSCDFYKRKFGTSVSYTLNGTRICLNKTSVNPSVSDDRWYMYYLPGRCGIPINISGTTYYLTPSKTYTINGKTITIDEKIRFTDNEITAYRDEYISVVTNNPSQATIYEGWDYITNKLGATLVIACDKDTGNIITLDGKTYSQFEMVNKGSYTKNAWNIDGYEYLGYLTKNDFLSPSVPISTTNSNNKVELKITSSDIEKGYKKQIIFVYQKSDKIDDKQEVKLSIINKSTENNETLYTGKFIIDDDKLTIKLYDATEIEKYNKIITYDAAKGYSINTNDLESILKIDTGNFEYVGNLVKTHKDYYLTYLGEKLEMNSGNIYDLKNIDNNKVHIIIGYKEKAITSEESPQLKISYIDEKGNMIEGKNPIITQEKIEQEIVKKADDLKKQNYMYIGYIYVDSQNEFEDIVNPLTINGTDETIITKFLRDKDRRHIAFVYKKVELKFDVDIQMLVNDLENQYVNQIESEDYWVLDETGKVILKINVIGDEELNITNYNVKLRIPFDVYMNGNFVDANSINNLNVEKLSEIIVADSLCVPIWVDEKEYYIDVVIEATVEGFGVVSANQKDNVEIVGRLYDFTVINLDGSEKTGDKKWKDTLFVNETNEYKASKLPIGQLDNQPKKYNYGIKLGTTFYFNVNTKGNKNNAILVEPKFLYVSPNGNTVKEVDVYINDGGNMKNILTENTSELYMKMKDNDILKSEVVKEIEKSLLINKVSQRYNYALNVNRNIGTLSNLLVSKYLSLPYLNYISEFKELYGVNAMSQIAKTENELLTYANHWYGKYVIPASAKVVPKGMPVNISSYKNGYLIVCFKINSLDGNDEKYLSYDLPKNKTQWQTENLNQIINLPNIKNNDVNKSVVLNTIQEGYAPVVIYDVSASTSGNNTSIGTH